MPVLVICKNEADQKKKKKKKKKKWSRYGDDKVFLMLSLWALYVAMATRVPIWSAQNHYAAFPLAQ